MWWQWHASSCLLKTPGHRLLLHSFAHATHRSAVAFILYVSYRQLTHASSGTCNMWFCLCFLLVCFFVLPMGPTHSHTPNTITLFEFCAMLFICISCLDIFLSVCVFRFVCVRLQVHKWMKWMNGNKQKRNTFHDARYVGFFSFSVVFWSLCAVIIIIVIITVYDSRSMWIVEFQG